MPGTPWEWGAGLATPEGSGEEAGSPQTLKVLRAEKGIGLLSVPPKGNTVAVPTSDTSERQVLPR